MGNCVQAPAQNVESNTRNRSRPSSSRGTVGKSQALKKERIKWKTDIPLSQEQICGKREEFWDTAPAFEGRQEIWDALRAAVEALEKNECEMAQAIVDGANIILPKGSLIDCYDELGNRYQLPLYVLSYPANLLEEGAAGCPGCHGDNTCSAATSSGACTTSGAPPILEENREPRNLVVRFRLSTGAEFRLSVRLSDTVGSVKEELGRVSGFPASRQRWYCCGQVLPDRATMEDCRIPPAFVVQVVVHTPDDIIPNVAEG